MLKLIESLLDDGVIIFEEELNKVDALLKAYPDLITDIIKVHKLAEENRDVVRAEHIYPAENSKLIYELVIFDVDEITQLCFALDALGIRSKNLLVCIVYPSMDEGDD